jgi:site-specific recombinase XerD
MKCNFNLSDKNKDMTSILIRSYINKQKLSFATGKSIEPHRWSADKQRVKGYSADAKIINNWLDDLERIFSGIIADFQRQGETLTVEKVKKELTKRTGGKEESLVTLYSFWELRLAEMKNLKSYNTIRNYKLSLSKLRAFQSEISFEEVTIDFYNKLVNRLYDDGCSTNYVAKILTHLAKIMDDAFERNLHSNLMYKKRSFKIPSAKTDRIVLSLEEIKTIYCTQNLSIEHELKRDLFVFACYTGLRYSDWDKIRAENVTIHEGISILTIETQKTKSLVSIPLNAVCLDILKKYENGFELMSNQKVNEGLKDICKLACLDRKVSEKTVRGNMTEDKKGDLWEFVTCHTARRSFVTNLIKKGMERENIKKMTGHTSDAAFNKYDKETVLENAIKIANDMAY